MNNDENSPWQYKPTEPNGDTEEASAPNQAANTSNQPMRKEMDFSWTAAEYIEHERGAGWYILLAIVTVVLTAGIYFLTRDYFAGGATAAACVIVGVYAGRKPRQVTYQLTGRGLTIGQKSYPYRMFKTFSIIDEGELSSLSLMPTKRLMPPISAYFDPKDEEMITDLVGEHLPYEQHKLDAIDRLTRRLRF